MVNGGYQHDDARMYDYALTDFCDLPTRGPIPYPDQPYFSAIGAAQVFGRFTDRPFPTIVGEAIGMPALNLGYSGSGPSFFLRRPELIRQVNRGRFAIVHLMSGRSLSNSRLRVGLNQGVLAPRVPPEAPLAFAEPVYDRLLSELTPEEARLLREENRAIYVAQMNALLRRIRVPKVLLYWSDRAPDYEERTSDVHGFWGGFPHFVNRAVIDAIRPQADAFVEVVGRRGLPQPLRDRETGEPVVLWPETVPVARDHNHYYPSPEMNEDAAAALIAPCAQIARKGRQRTRRVKDEPRDLLLNLEIFASAAAPLDRPLRESFGSGCARVPGERIDPNELARRRIKAATVQASAAIAEPDARVRLHRLIVLRDPMLRARAVYDQARAPRRAKEDDPSSAHARESSFAEWLDWCLGHPRAARTIANYQTRMLAGDHDPVEPRSLGYHDVQKALASIEGAHVVVAERAATDLARLEARLRPIFPEITLFDYAPNDAAERPTEASVRQDLDEALYGRLLEANVLDRLLIAAVA